MKLYQIAIADDHALFRSGLAEIINHFKQFSVLFCAEDGNDLLDKMAENQPDIVLLDLNMPDMDGFDAFQKIKELYEDVKVIVLSMFDEEKYILHSFQLGVNGYLLKNTDPEILEEALSKVVEDGIYLTPPIARLLASDVYRPKRKPSLVAQRLTDREKEILSLITQGMTNKEIGEKMCLAKRTIDGQRQTLLDKSDSKNTAELVAWAFREGLLK